MCLTSGQCGQTLQPLALPMCHPDLPTRAGWGLPCDKNASTSPLGRATPHGSRPSSSGHCRQTASGEKPFPTVCRGPRSNTARHWNEAAGGPQLHTTCRFLGFSPASPSQGCPHCGAADQHHTLRASSQIPPPHGPGIAGCQTVVHAEQEQEAGTGCLGTILLFLPSDPHIWTLFLP